MQHNSTIYNPCVVVKKLTHSALNEVTFALHVTSLHMSVIGTLGSHFSRETQLKRQAKRSQ